MSIADAILEARGYIVVCYSFADLLTGGEIVAELTEAKLPKLAALAAIDQMVAEGLLVPRTRRDCIAFASDDDPDSGVYEERDAFYYVPVGI